MSVAVPSAAQLRAGQTIFVRGHISFSRLAAHIAGDELVRSIAAAKARGSRYPTDKPHTTISLVDAQVIPVDPQAPTPEEIFVNSKIYTVKKGDNAGKRGFTLDDKSPNLPPVFEPIPPAEQDGGGTHRQLVLDNDLDSGLDVTLVLSTFQQGDYANKGLGIQQVILNEEPRYYAGANVDNTALSAIGVTIAGPVQRVTPTSQAAPTQGAPEGSVVTEEGYALPGPNSFGAPVAQPAQQVATPPATQPASGGDPAAANIAALEAQLAAAKAAQPPATAQGASAFDVPADNPWGENTAPGIGFGG